jgi:RHS repeat-associated protein
LSFNGISNPSFTYDGNGNMTGRAASANIAWSSYNYPTAISYAGKEPVAVYSRTAAGVNTMSYILGDSRGSVTVIASDTGVPDIGESYTAFGVRRNPNTWSGAPATADLNTIAGISRQGFTFQTALGQSMGLNHMNGRVQDAILGRFLSPDPHVPDPTNAQSYNRYSYVNNNPLTQVDPTGFENKFILPDGSPDSDSFNFTTTTYNAGGTNTSPSADDQTQSQDPTQGTNSDSSLDYIQITATRLIYDPTTGTISELVGSTNGGGGYIPFGNSSTTVDYERATQAALLWDAAANAREYGEAQRQQDIYYTYCGCSSGPTYSNSSPPPPSPPPQLPQTGGPSLMPPAPIYIPPTPMVNP